MTVMGPSDHTITRLWVGLLASVADRASPTERTMIDRRILTLILGILAFGSNAITTVVAQPYPNRPVRFLVPFPAGGATDVAARIIGEYLSRSFRSQFFVENRSGAGGNIGIEASARSQPDGYTLLFTADYVASAAHISRLNIDHLNDLVPV